jgi:transmembrane sensor
LDSEGPKGPDGGSGWPVRIALGAAASLIIYLLVAGGWVALNSGGWISYTTSIGGYEHVKLPDGSGVQLNTDSEIQARITPEKREVRVTRGEALFTVASDARRPFTVSAGNTRLRANPADGSGTEFVVRKRAAKDVDVAVTRGSLVLGPSDRIIDVVLGRDSAFESTVAAGYSASVRANGILLAKIEMEELNRKLSWTGGLLTFKGETLAEVTDEFNRFNRMHLLVTDPSIAHRRIGGAFRSTDPQSFVSALKKSFGVRADERVVRNGDAPIILLSRAN